MKIYSFIIVLLFSYYNYAQENNGDKLYQLGSYTKAIAAFKADTSKAYNQYMIAKAYDQLENFELAITHYQKAIAIDSTLQLQKFELANLYLQIKQFDNAIKLYNLLIEEDSTNPTFFYYLGLAYENKDNKEEANKNFLAAYNIDKNYLKASYKLAANALLSNNYDYCLALLKEGLAINPNNIDFINLRAIYHYDVQNYPAAIPWFEKLIAKGQESATIYKRLATCYYDNHEYEKAIAILKKQQELEQNNPDIFFKAGLCYSELKEYTKAETAFNQAIILKQPPPLKNEYEELAFVYQRLEKHLTALKYYKLASKEDPEDAILYYKIAVAADSAYTKAEQKLPYFVEAEKHVTHIYFKKFIDKRLKELNEELLSEAN